MTQATRRGIIAAGLALPALATAPAKAETSSAIFVLVHGAWHGGWCWERVAAKLRTAGARAFAPTLTGLGERSHLLAPSIDLSTHIADVVNEIVWKDLRDVILVGHSYAGMVITGVAEKIPERLKAVVYLDALLPEDGQAARDITGFPLAGSPEPIKPISVSFMVNAADADWVEKKLTPQPGLTFAEKIKTSGAINKLPGRVYIQATTVPVPFFTTLYQKAKADPAWKAYQIACRHDAMLDEPGKLAEILLASA